MNFANHDDGSADTLETFLLLFLPDGKSKDLLTMKQNEVEWIEYRNVMEDVARRSGLDKRIFYDLRGNHDNFGVPEIGGSSDFFSNYSINGQFGRKGNLNSVTVEVGLYLQNMFSVINCCFQGQMGGSKCLSFFFLVIFAAFVPKCQNYDYRFFFFLVISASFNYLYLDSCCQFQSFETLRKYMIFLHFLF
jgi:hypothetical protein